MRGFAIPRRWVISLALVGLVSLFAATLTASWMDPSRAAAATTGGTATPTATATNTPTPTSTPPPSELTLSKVAGAPNGATIHPGDSIRIWALPFNTSNVQRNDIPYDYLVFAIIGSGHGTLSSSSQPLSATFNATSAGDTLIRVYMDQGSVNVYGDFTIHSQTPAATATPVPTVANPGPVPTSIPNASKVITPAEGGMTSASGNSKISISVPAGATTTFKGVTIDTSTGDVPPAGPGTGFKLGNTVVKITFYDENGNPLSGTRLDRAAEVCLPVTAADIAAAAGGVGGLTVMRYDEPSGQWIPLVGTYNALTGQVCAHSSNFSLFGVGTSTDFPPAPGGANLPATGDTPISAGFLAFLGVTGIALLGIGGLALKRSRKAGSIE